MRGRVLVKLIARSLLGKVSVAAALLFLHIQFGLRQKLVFAADAVRVAVFISSLHIIEIDFPHIVLLCYLFDTLHLLRGLAHEVILILVARWACRSSHC